MWLEDKIRADIGPALERLQATDGYDLAVARIAGAPVADLPGNLDRVGIVDYGLVELTEVLIGDEEGLWGEAATLEYWSRVEFSISASTREILTGLYEVIRGLVDGKNVEIQTVTFDSTGVAGEAGTRYQATVPLIYHTTVSPLTGV